MKLVNILIKTAWILLKSMNILVKKHFRVTNVVVKS